MGWDQKSFIILVVWRWHQLLSDSLSKCRLSRVSRSIREDFYPNQLFRKTKQGKNFSIEGTGVYYISWVNRRTWNFRYTNDKQEVVTPTSFWPGTYASIAPVQRQVRSGRLPLAVLLPPEQSTLPYRSSTRWFYRCNALIGYLISHPFYLVIGLENSTWPWSDLLD